LILLRARGGPRGARTTRYAWEGGRVVDYAAVRDYWNRQFAAISNKGEPEDP
jgi:hypothetical protein